MMQCMASIATNILTRSAVAPVLLRHISTLDD
jgi:hypothetical protein